MQTVHVISPHGIDPKMIVGVIECELRIALGNGKLHRHAGEFHHKGTHFTVYHINAYATKGTATILDDGTLVALCLGSLTVEDMEAIVAKNDSVVN